MRSAFTTKGEIYMLKHMVNNAAIMIEQKDAAIDAAIRALDRLSKKGSITRELREETMAQLWAARQTPLEGIDEPPRQ